MRIKKFLVFAAMACGLIGCKNSALRYNPGMLDGVPCAKATMEPIVENLECRYPAQIAVSDSLVIVLDAAVNDNIFHIYDHKGNILTKFGKKGRGYGELINTPTYFSLDGQSVFVADKNKIIQYDLPKILSGKDQSIHQIAYSELFGSQHVFHNILVRGGAYFCFRMTPDSRLTILSLNSNVATKYDTMPALVDSDKVSEDNHIIWRYMSRNCVSPDGQFIAQSTYIGAVLDILKLASEKVQPVSTQYIIQPVYKKIDNNNLTITEKTVIGFDAICCTNEYVFGLINGNEGKDLRDRDFQTPFSREITVFDWAGNLEKKIKTPDMMTSIYVMPDNRSGYAVTYTDGNYSLAKVEW